MLADLQFSHNYYGKMLIQLEPGIIYSISNLILNLKRGIVIRQNNHNIDIRIFALLPTRVRTVNDHARAGARDSTYLILQSFKRRSQSYIPKRFNCLHNPNRHPVLLCLSYFNTNS